jgi:hypothetical protein
MVNDEKPNVMAVDPKTTFLTSTMQQAILIKTRISGKFGMSVWKMRLKFLVLQKMKIKSS